MHSFHRWSSSNATVYISYLSYLILFTLMVNTLIIIFEKGLWWQTSWLRPLFPHLSILGQETTDSAYCSLWYTGTAASMLHGCIYSVWTPLKRDWNVMSSAGPRTKNGCAGEGSRNLPYSTLIKWIPVNGGISSIGHKYHVDMADCWRRLHFIQSLWELQIMYVLWMFKFWCLFKGSKLEEIAQNQVILKKYCRP
jgi:hypothetical protein